MIYAEYLDFKRGVDFLFFMIFHYFTQAFFALTALFYFCLKKYIPRWQSTQMQLFAQKTQKRADTLRKQVKEKLILK